MADLQLNGDELRPIVQEAVRLAIAELVNLNQLVHGKLALTEAHAAELIELHSWQLRDVRYDGKIGFSKVTGGKIRYTQADVLEYLRRTHKGPSAG